ncbi:unnamed protein product [Phyllotreta striolata]|uniref:Uncharacterized protein n=1 Tax=Phyllotreta striolata TaxID=444603 RepID=A0A9N9U134_PHYSR|nr:unnamed protein product [Phyllotreta striolata]
MKFKIAGFFVAFLLIALADADLLKRLVKKLLNFAQWYRLNHIDKNPKINEQASNFLEYIEDHPKDGLYPMGYPHMNPYWPFLYPYAQMEPYRGIGMYPGMGYGYHYSPYGQYPDMQGNWRNKRQRKNKKYRKKLLI